VYHYSKPHTHTHTLVVYYTFLAIAEIVSYSKIFSSEDTLAGMLRHIETNNNHWDGGAEMVRLMYCPTERISWEGLSRSEKGGDSGMTRKLKKMNVSKTNVVDC